jgi:hypothetical protein
MAEFTWQRLQVSLERLENTLLRSSQMEMTGAFDRILDKKQVDPFLGDDILSGPSSSL